MMFQAYNIPKLQYDIWGNTVNVASRMESCGLAGKLQCTEEVYNTMKNCPKFQFTHRGQVTVKGKGQMTTFWLKNSDEQEAIMEKPKTDVLAPSLDDLALVKRKILQTLNRQKSCSPSLSYVSFNIEDADTKNRRSIEEKIDDLQKNVGQEKEPLLWDFLPDNLANNLGGSLGIFSDAKNSPGQKLQACNFERQFSRHKPGPKITTSWLFDYSNMADQKSSGYTTPDCYADRPDNFGFIDEVNAWFDVSKSA